MSDRRVQYALAVQASAKQEIEHLRLNRAVTGTEWAFPLEAAPAAVCTMAILLKTASKKELAGMEVKSLVVTGDQGKKLGNLPDKLFHANLEHCGQLGQSAFREAQKTMDLISQTADSMVRDDGSISYIIELLEDMEAADTELMPEVKNIEEVSNQCLADIEALCKNFEYWYWFICCLKMNAVIGKGRAQEEENERKLKQKVAAEEKAIRAEREETARKKTLETEAGLEEAKMEIERARKEVEKLASQPSDPEPSYLEQLEQAEKAIAAMEPPKKEGGALGLLKKVKVGVFGENQKEYEARVARFEELKQKKESWIAEERARREQARQRAADRLKAAKESEEKLRAEIETARSQLMETLDQHQKAKETMAEASAKLKRLGAEKTELKTILDILDSSISQLAELKNHVNQLVKFFDMILVEVTKGVNDDVKKFLDPVKRGAEKGKVVDMAKKRIVAQSLHIQSSFSTIRDISGTFVKISNNYIGPAIEQMERLAHVPDKEWDSATGEFTEQCKLYMSEIRQLAASASQDMRANVQNRIEYLSQHALNVSAAA